MKILKVCWSAFEEARGPPRAPPRAPAAWPRRGTRGGRRAGRPETPSAVGGGEQILAEHQRRIERGDVHVQDVAGDALLEHRGVAARDAPARLRGGHRLAAMQVLAHQQRVDLGRVAAQHGRLVVERQGLGLHEVGRRQDRRHRQGLQHVVARVGHEPRGVLHEDARDVLGREVRAVGRGHAEVPRDVLEAVGREVPRAHVVELGQDPRVHDVAADHRVAPVADRCAPRPACGRDTRAARSRRGPTRAAPGAGGRAPRGTRGRSGRCCGLPARRDRARGGCREHSARSCASDISAPDSTAENPVESASAIAMMRSDSRAAFGNSNPGAVVTSMSSAMRRRSPKAMPRNDVLPDAQQELMHRIVEEPVRGRGRSRALAGDAQAVVANSEGLRPRTGTPRASGRRRRRRAGSPPRRP